MQMLGAVVLCCAVFPYVAAFDKSALIPSLDEARQALAQMASGLQAMASVDAGRVYHEVLVIEELLTKMKDTITEQQDADTNFTMTIQAEATADIALFDDSLRRLLGEMDSLTVAHDQLTANVTAVRLAVDAKTVSLDTVHAQLEATHGECDRIVGRHDASSAASTADIASVSRVLEASKDVECSKLSTFLQTMDVAIPSGVSLLQLVDCPCQSLLQSDGMTEGCDCATTGDSLPSEIVEFTCEKRRENIRELLRSLLEQLHSASAQESNAFERSYAACKADEVSQRDVQQRLTAELASLHKLFENATTTLEHADKEMRVVNQSIHATRDALASSQANRISVHTAFSSRFEQRVAQVELVESILQLLSDLSKSKYSEFHLTLHDMCPKLCSRHGVCVGGNCECYDNFVGSDCSIDMATRECPFAVGSSPCTADACSQVDFQNLGSAPTCAAVVCDHCRDHPTSDSACVYTPTAMFCADRDRVSGCKHISCPAVEPSCGLRRAVRSNFTGCCFNPLLDCVDKCTDIDCGSESPTCSVGKAVRYPLRDCCFNPVTDCVDECAVMHCSQEEPICAIGKKVRTPYAGCCFNATVDCENECTTVVCNDEGLPVDVCRAMGLRWTGANTGCCFDAATDCASGDDSNQATERFVLEALFNATDGLFWYHQADTHWMTSTWICFWFGVECSGAAGSMTVTAVRLPANGLSGMIPKEIGLLTNMTLLDLSDNFIGGPIPKEMASLRKLQSLKLRHNELSGVIPTFLGDLLDLEILDLGFNFLNGSLPSALEASDSLSVSCSNNCICGSTSCQPLRSEDVTSHSKRKCDPCM